MFLVDLPNQDPSKPWIVIEQQFKNREEAIAFTQKIWNTDEQGKLNLISYDGEYYTIDVPNPNYSSSNNQFLEVEGFRHKSDAIDFVIANYNADEEGRVSLINSV